jgi:hypothetical protein
MQHNQRKKADATYNQKLAKVAAENKIKSAELQLPPLTEHQDAVLANNLSFNCYRIAKVAFKTQGKRTDYLNKHCSIGNVSGAVIGFKGGNERALKNIGLKIYCDRVKAKNKFGAKTQIGHWFVEVQDQQKWQEAELKAQQAAA